jgi:hypothetical protein
MTRSFISFLLAALLASCGGDDSGGSSGDNNGDNKDNASNNPSTAVLTALILPGDADCPNGGILIETGVDENANGVLDSNEIDASEKVCNGEDGTTGINGISALVTQSTEPAGSNCINGGVRFDVGTDTNDNSILETAEISSTEYLCNGIDGLTALVAQTVEAAGANCSNGGVRIDAGIDSNVNNLLDTSEVTTTEYICNGQDGSSGANGLTALVTQSIEAAGSNCTYGGTRIDSGLDANSNNALDLAEISATSYVCASAANIPANGFAATDAWGEVWDGLPRQLATFSEAETICNSLGARLPTASEIYRNNLSTGISTNSISSTSATEYLWTVIPTTTADTNVLVRLSDGAVTTAAISSDKNYRCVWPDTSPSGFDQNACYGNPGEECWSYKYGQNIDSQDRVALDYASASAECEFYNASLPVFSDWDSFIHNELPNAQNQYLWSANAMYWYSGNYGQALIKWQGDTDSKQFSFDNLTSGNGSLSNSSSPRAFRCVGQEDTSQLISATNPDCNGGCFNTSSRRSVLSADSTDRTAATHDVAATTCRSLGADLPNAADISDLIHQGLPNGSNNWLWLSDPAYWYNNGFGHATARWAGTGFPEWSYIVNSGGLANATTPNNYRCVWRQKINDLPVCNGADGIDQTQNSYSCVSSTDGDSSGNAVPGGSQLVDTWGNAWDLQQRAAATHIDAESACTAIGGRLPTASEVYAVRDGQSLSSAIGDSFAVDYIWTKTPHPTSASYVTVRVSDGGTSTSVDTTPTPYRCVWPSSKGNILSGRACHGDCFSPEATYIADAYDRPALPAASASEECNAAGGRLPDFREMQSLVQQGWENGSDDWLWISEPMYWYNGGYGQALVRWNGTGPSDWTYIGTTYGTRNVTTASNPFRCIYSSRVR